MDCWRWCHGMFRFRVLIMAEQYDMVVIGAGISGLSMAWRARQAGMRVLVLEREQRAGGCFHSVAVDDGGSPFWLELGTHTCFNSYTRLLAMLQELGLAGQLQARRKLRYRLLADGRLYSIPSRLHWLELFGHAWRLFSLDKAGRSVAGYYRTLVGERNYREVFRHAFNAVICQPADNVPADMLFRKRSRNKDVMRSFTMPQGLQQIIDALEKRLDCRKGQEIRSLRHEQGRFDVVTDDAHYAARLLVCATPTTAAGRLLRDAFPDIARRLSAIDEVVVESVGVVVERQTLSLEEIAGIIAADDDFYSAVSRDVVDHEHWRGFSFHFRPGRLDKAGRLRRVCEVLGVDEGALQHVFHKTNRLPAPDMEHHARIAGIDRALDGLPLGLVGNYFAGVAVEDCLERVEKECARLSLR